MLLVPLVMTALQDLPEIQDQRALLAPQELMEQTVQPGLQALLGLA